MFNLEKILRENIKLVQPYKSARDEYKGTEGTFLDANENSFGSAAGNSYHRYPDPMQKQLKEKISKIKNIAVSQIFLGNGSDEPIDLMVRAVCRPGIDNIIIMPPTYGMYEVSAGINDIKIKEVNLTEDYQLRPDKILEAVDANTKIIFICSPNNPTGNALNEKDIKMIIEGFNGLVVVDEAYVDFAPNTSFLPELMQYPNMVVLQTFSKAWGMAALRLGMAFASAEIVSILSKIKPPYNINGATQEIALKGLNNVAMKDRTVKEILGEREKLREQLSKLPSVEKVYPSDSNFLLVKTKSEHKMYDYLISKKVVTRDRSKVILCEGCLRITIGTPEENRILLDALKSF